MSGELNLYTFVKNTTGYSDLLGLEKCKLDADGLKKLGESPDGMYNAHKHHIVREKAPKNWSFEEQKWVTEAQRIIEEVGIKLNSSIENFVWAPNGLGNHTKKAAKAVYEGLAKVDGKGVEAVTEKLSELGGKFADAVFR